jgi:hypothetical protein
MPARRCCFAFVVACASLALIAPGCHKGGGSAALTGPSAVAAAFDKAMHSGDLTAGVELFAYSTIARGQNEDWDSFGEAQRKLIIDKVKEDKVQELGRLRQAYVNGGYNPGAASTSGAQASVPFQGLSGTLTMTLVQEGGGWKILQIQ